MHCGGALLRQGQVLSHESDLEATLVVLGSGSALDVAGSWVVSVDAPVVGGRHAQDLHQNLGVDAQLLGQDHALGGSDHLDAQNEVVSNFSGFSGSGASAVEHLLAHALQHSLGVVEVGFGVRAHHEGKGAVGSAHNSTGHRCIIVRHVKALSDFTELLGGDGRDGTAIHNAGAGGSVLEDTLVGAEDLLYVLSPGETGHDVVGILDGFGNRSNRVDSHILCLLAGFSAEVEAVDLESVLGQVGSHGETHVSHADEADLSRELSANDMTEHF
mmetsp:Transcript_39647/g.60716  ORF Transcript_39647/g.60716 Transcript_39647/m.60716 type:complete len:272 (+) Transcript_39647:146-961(+)